MAEPLVAQFGKDVPQRIAAGLKAHYQAFDESGFLSAVLHGFDDLNLMARGKHIATMMGRYLPDDFNQAAAIVTASLEQRPVSMSVDGGMASFFYLPHTLFVAEFGLDDFDTAMQLQYLLTQRFTAEFSMRAFLLRHTQATLERFRDWARDDNEHVRRLVSESTRPRLPWAQRLPMFQRDPAPVLALLELLKDDTSLYVRRSVANNLNDIGKDNPDLLIKTARRWQKGASVEREWLIRHALRSAIKRGSADALTVLGYGETPAVSVGNSSLLPARAERGRHITIAFTVTSTSKKEQNLLVDFRIHYVKANGACNPKVFKLKSLMLAPGASVRLEKKISLAEMTTRKHYPGTHEVDVLVNGAIFSLGSFELI